MINNINVADIMLYEPTTDLTRVARVRQSTRSLVTLPLWHMLTDLMVNRQTKAADFVQIIANTVAMKRYEYKTEGIPNMDNV